MPDDSTGQAGANSNRFTFTERGVAAALSLLRGSGVLDYPNLADELLVERMLRAALRAEMRVNSTAEGV